MSEDISLDYSLTGESSVRAVENGLADADWYTTPLPRKEMRVLLVRRNGPAIRDTLLLFSLLVISAYYTITLWGTWWVLIPYIIYSVLYGTSSDSRWHECGHGTAFKTDWMNALVYEIASFMVMRESVLWVWSHTRHHSDTVIVGRDPEIGLPRPPDLVGFFLGILNIGVYKTHYPSLIKHACGKIT
ncbi:MAG: fatty acid desaturase, partial [Lentisphaeria bacterium]|nr:fatty acid desaturase [Lentisphaeria bacterium]NQZ69734.1 fatty acid desaturase [Lentisphaeria bacterium]